VDIDGIGLIVKIFRRPVIPEKMVPVKSEASVDRLFEFRCSPKVADTVQGDKIEACVEVIDPSLRRRFAVIPRAVRVLLGYGVARGVESGLDVLLLTRDPADPA